MSAPPIVDPPAPYVGPIPQGLHPGKMVRIQGVALPDGDRFVVNLATGPNEYQDDIGLHLSVRLNQGYIARNSYINGEWLDEQGDGVLPIAPGQRFEILLLCDINDYKVAVNGQHFCEFPYRTPYRRMTHLHVNGDLKITLISWEGSAPPQMGDMSTAPRPPFEAPPPRPPFDAPPPQYSSLGYGPAAAPGYGPPPSAGYGAPPATTAHENYVPPPSHALNNSAVPMPPLPNSSLSYGFENMPHPPGPAPPTSYPHLPPSDSTQISNGSSHAPFPQPLPPSNLSSAGYPNPFSAGYPNPSSAGYPNPSSAGYPNPSSAGYPNPSSAGYPNPPSAGYPNPSSAGYPYPNQARFPSPPPGYDPEPVYTSSGPMYIPKKVKRSKMKQVLKYGVPIVAAGAGVGVGAYYLADAVHHFSFSSGSSSSSSSSSDSD